jgi:hypothetical protein
MVVFYLVAWRIIGSANSMTYIADRANRHNRIRHAASRRECSRYCGSEPLGMPDMPTTAGKKACFPYWSW